jgi:hypothetical protein
MQIRRPGVRAQPILVAVTMPAVVAAAMVITATVIISAVIVVYRIVATIVISVRIIDATIIYRVPVRIGVRVGIRIRVRVSPVIVGRIGWVIDRIGHGDLRRGDGRANGNAGDACSYNRGRVAAMSLYGSRCGKRSRGCTADKDRSGHNGLHCCSPIGGVFPGRVASFAAIIRGAP